MDKEKALSCAVVRDLLPLYHDGVVSEATRAEMEAHLKDCPACAEEYTQLCKELPLIEQAPSTKARFVSMVTRGKRRQRLITIVSALLICGLLVGAYFGQMQLPITNVPDKEIEVLGAYRYQTDEGYKLFMMYEAPNYGYSTGKAAVEKHDTLVLNIKKPLITDKSKESRLHFWVYEYGWESGDNGREFLDFSTVKLGGKVIWTKTVNLENDIPDYVYAYDEFREVTGQMQGWSWDEDEGWVAAVYKDGTMTKWDFEGNILTDTHNK